MKLFGGAVLAVAALSAVVIAEEPSEQRINVARFSSADELIFPADADRWVLLGANIGGDYSEDDFDPKNPGAIGVVQMEPAAYDYFLKNGAYADGTMLLLSFYDTQEKPAPDLSGFVQGDISAREIHLIDRQKFADERGFYLFSGTGDESSAVLPAGNECVQCHAEHGEFDSTFTQFYPTIRHIISND